MEKVTLLQLFDNLGAEEFAAIKFFCEDVLTVASLDKIGSNRLELINKLHEVLFDQEVKQFLHEMFNNIRRIDLTKQLKITADGSYQPKVTRFRKLLFEIDEELTEPERRDLIGLIPNTVISKRDKEKPILQVYTLLLKNTSKEDIVNMFIPCLSGRRDLQRKLRDYLQTNSCQPPGSPSSGEGNSSSSRSSFSLDSLAKGLPTGALPGATHPTSDMPEDGGQGPTRLNPTVDGASDTIGYGRIIITNEHQRDETVYQRNADVNQSAVDSSFNSRYYEDFEPLKVLGRGAYGVVHESKHKLSGRRYAVKRVALPIAGDAVEKHLREVKVLAKLEHRAIVKYSNAWIESPPQPGWYKKKDSELGTSHLDDDYYSTGSNDYDEDDEDDEDDDDDDDDDNVGSSDQIRLEDNSLGNTLTGWTKKYLFIQMELCQTETLKNWLLNHTENRARKEICDIFKQILSGIEFVHEEGFMHRDLKPGNIFFARDNSVKIGDFGLVKAFYDDRTENQSGARWKSKSHTADAGTKMYMSPELLAGEKYTHNVDIYALGVIWLEMLIPFSTVMEKVRTLNKAKELKFPDTFVQDYPKERELIAQLLSKNPDERPSAKEILESDCF